VKTAAPAGKPKGRKPKNRYGWMDMAPGKAGSRPKAQIVGEELERIKKKYGTLDDETILREATKLKSPLHSLFEWDNEVAAHEHRLGQAQQLLRAIAYFEPQGDGTYIKVRAFVNIGSARAQKGEYLHIKVAMRKADTRLEVLTRAYNDFQALARKYEHLQEFAALVSRIKKFPKPS